MNTVDALSRSYVKPSAWFLLSTRVTLVFAMLCVWVVMLWARPFMAPQFKNLYLSYIPYILLIAFYAADMARSILAHPFSYTMPGHLEAMRRRLLTIGLVGNALFIVPMLFYPVEGLVRKEQAISGVFCAGLTLYFGAVVLIFHTGARKWGWPLLIANLLFGGLWGIGFMRDLGAYTPFLTENPLFILPASFLLAKFWTDFSRRELSRGLVSKPIVAFADLMDPRKNLEIQAMDLAEQRQRESVQGKQWVWQLASITDGLFCFRMQRALAWRRMRLYQASRNFWPRMIAMSGFLVLMALRFGPQDLGRTMLYTMCIFLGFPDTSPVASPYLPYDRRSLCSATILTGLIRIGSTVLVSVLLWAALALPTELRLGRVIDLAGLSGLGFSLLLAPYYLILNLFRRSAVDGTFMVISVAAMMFSLLLYEMFFGMYLEASVPTLIALHLSGWLLYVPATYLRYTRFDLLRD